MTQSTLAPCVPKILSVDQGRALVDEWRQSGLSRAAYARQHHIGAHLLTYWAHHSSHLIPPHEPCAVSDITQSL
jgi:hypothetical protein